MLFSFNYFSILIVCTGLRTKTQNWIQKKLIQVVLNVTFVIYCCVGIVFNSCVVTVVKHEM